MITPSFSFLEEIESRSGFKGGFRFAGRLLAIGDTMSVYGGEDLFERLNGLFLEWRVWGKDRELNLKCVNDIYSLSLDFIVKAVEKRYRVYGKAYSKYCPRI